MLKKEFLSYTVITAFSLAVCSCQTKETVPFTITCLEDCDSISYDYEGDKLKGIYTYHDGQMLGRFVLFDKDTVFGYNEFVDDYFKRTTRINNDSKVLVELFTLRDQKYKLTERIVNTEGKVSNTYSHYLSIENENDTVIIRPFVEGQFNQMNLYRGDSVIARSDSLSSVLKVSIETLKPIHDISLYIYNSKGTDSEGYKETEGIFFPLSAKRIKQQNIFTMPNEWVMSPK